ncbi:inner membrane protein [Salmonella enterica subsp. arizonae]|nr:inner membrane protein [Salmonella enterica subsp. arizonae]
MALTVKALNTGVIRHNDKFIALALKVKSLRNKETLLFFPVLALRDLLIGLEQRLYLQHSLAEQEEEKRQKTKISHVRKMHENIPAIAREELENADINQRVESLALSDNSEDVLTFSLNLHNGSQLDLQIGEWQVEVLVMAIIHAINNAEMRELALRISSMLDFYHYTTLTAWKTAIWNSIPITSPTGNIICITIIWRSFIVTRMNQGNHMIAAPSLKPAVRQVLKKLKRYHAVC